MSEHDDQWTEMNAQLAAIAPALNKLVKDPQAVVHYDMLSGGLWWSDERPAYGSPDEGYADVLRYLLHYRTTVINGSPEDGYLPLWLAAKDKFPRWPGFAEERCRQDEALTATYERLSKRAFLSLDVIDIVCRLNKCFEGMVPAKIIEKHAYSADPPDISVGELHDLTCRCLRLAGKDVPADAWQRIVKCVSESLGVRPDRISRESKLAHDLK